MQDKRQRVMLMNSFSYGHVMSGECARVQYWRMEQEALVYLFHLRIVSKPVSVWNLSTIQLELKLNAHIYVVEDDDESIVKRSNYDVLFFTLINKISILKRNLKNFLEN